MAKDTFGIVILQSQQKVISADKEVSKYKYSVVYIVHVHMAKDTFGIVILQSAKSDISR